MTTFDAPRRYRTSHPYWFFAPSEDDRDDVCFGFDPQIRAELERLERKQYDFDYPRDPDRVKELEELLEPAR